MEELFRVNEKRLSAVEIVINKIKKLLIEKKLLPGDIIPNEKTLAERLQVGRGAVREAVKILSAYGVLEIRRGSGTYISSASNRRLFDVHLFQILLQDSDYQSLIQVRSILEEGIVRLVIQNATEEDLSYLDSAMNRFVEELTKDNISIDMAMKYDLEYHRLLGTFSHNPIIENIYEFVIELFSPTINPIHEGVIDVHKGLHDAIVNRDIGLAIQWVRKHTEIWIEAHVNYTNPRI